MALKPCKECGNLISDSASECPSCGHVPGTQLFGCILLAVFGGLIALMVISGFCN